MSVDRAGALLLLTQKHADLDRARSGGFEPFLNRGQRIPAVEDVIQDQNMSILHVRQRDLFEDYFPTGLRFSVIARDAQAIEAQRQLNPPHQISHENKAAIQNGDDRQFFIAIIFRDLRRDFVQALQNRRLVKQNALKVVLHLRVLGHVSTKDQPRDGETAMLVCQMRVRHDQIVIGTKGKGTYEITDAVQEKIDISKIDNGTVTVFVQHTSCSLVMMENAASAARRDLEKFFEHLVPENADYEHDDEGPDDSTSHIRMALTHTSETIPIVDGKLELGTWQGVFLFEHRRNPHRRQVRLTIIGE